MPIIAAVQMTSSHIVADNLVKAGKFIKQAADAGAQLVILPEMFAIMGRKAGDKVAAQEPYGRGPIQDFLAAQARQYNIWVIAGTIPISTVNPDKVRLACLVYDQNGRVTARYDKIHMFDVDLGSEAHKESASAEPGTDIVVVDTPAGKVGLTVCYDIRFPGLFNELYRRGAEIISLPAAFTVPTGEAHWEVLTRARAIEGFGYLIGACQTGTHSSGRQTYGHSVIVDPWGAVLACLPKAEGILTADIDLGKVSAARNKIPVLQHQRL